MKKVTEQDLQLLVKEYLAGYSKTLNYEDLNRDYMELNEIRWARDRYQKLAARLAYLMAVELLERRKHEIQNVPETRPVHKGNPKQDR